MIDTSKEAAARLAGVMPRYFGVWSSTGVHIGVWDDGYLAHKVLSETPDGKLVEMVSIEDAGEYAAALSAEVKRLAAALDTALKGEQESEANLEHALHQLATARDDALEDAAKVAEAYDFGSPRDIADDAALTITRAIRAMKGKPHD